MSALGRVSDLGRRPVTTSTTQRPRLMLVRRPVRRAARTPFAVLLIIIAGVGLVGLLLINTGLQEGAVEISQLDRENQILRERVQAMTQSVDAAGAPQRLAARARALGMVSNPRPAFLRLSDGAVIGDPKAAEAPPPPPPPATATPTPPPAPTSSVPSDQPGPPPATGEGAQ
jgi:hypothetical protein